MKLSELAAKLGLKEAKTEQEILAKLDGVILIANDAGPAIEALRKIDGFATKPIAEIISFVNDKVVPHAGMGGNLISELHKQLANCVDMGRTKANEIKLLGERIVTLETNFANERKERSALLIEQALANGRMTAAEMPQWEKDFTNEATFDGALVRYKSLTAKIPTGSHVKDAGKQHAQAATRTQQVHEFVNEIMVKNPRMSYDQAFGKAKREKPDLFAGMVQPEDKTQRVVG